MTVTFILLVLSNCLYNYDESKGGSEASFIQPQSPWDHEWRIGQGVRFQLKQTLCIIGMLLLYFNAIFDFFMNLKKANLTWIKVSALFY